MDVLACMIWFSGPSITEGDRCPRLLEDRAESIQALALDRGMASEQDLCC